MLNYTAAKNRRIRPLHSYCHMFCFTFLSEKIVSGLRLKVDLSLINFLGGLKCLDNWRSQIKLKRRYDAIARARLKSKDNCVTFPLGWFLQDKEGEEMPLLRLPLAATLLALISSADVRGEISARCSSHLGNSLIFLD